MDAVDTHSRDPINSGWRLTCTVYSWSTCGTVAKNSRTERDPRISTRFRLDVQNQLADAGRASQTCPARDQILRRGRDSHSDARGGRPNTFTRTNNINNVMIFILHLSILVGIHAHHRKLEPGVIALPISL